MYVSRRANSLQSLSINSSSDVSSILFASMDVEHRLTLSASMSLGFPPPIRMFSGITYVEAAVKLVPLTIAFVLTLVHYYASSFRFLDRKPRSRWLSGAGGVTVAYVLVHLLPDLAKRQEQLQGKLSGWMGLIEHHIWLIVLIGLILFYGLELGMRAHGQDGEDFGHATGPNITCFGCTWYSMQSTMRLSDTS